MIESLQEKQTGLSPFISGLFARSEKSVSPEQAQVTRVSPGSPLSLLSRLSPAYTVIHPEASAQTFYGSSCQDSDSEGV